MAEKPILAGLLSGRLAELLSSYPPFRARQIYEWICRGAGTFTEMNNLPAGLRTELAGEYTLLPGAVSAELRDADGTVKLGITLDDGAVIEGVILRDGKERKTSCISSQAGCPAGCVFCKTGMLGFKRNLTAAEIAGQFLHLKREENDISHIVIMGMGEPLLNLDEVRKAVAFFTDPVGLNISKRRITLSTSGIVKGILDLAEQGPDIRLAVSLTTARGNLRKKLMPISGENPLFELKEALLAYQKTRERRITLEMVLLGGINTGSSDVKAAADFARGLNAVFNLIPWNPVSGIEFEGIPLKAPAPREVAWFAAALESRGLNVTRRTEKGSNISASCGQLGVVPPETGSPETGSAYS